MRYLRYALLGLLALAALVGGAVPVAQAATFTVTKTADTADGVCNADCSLREAIIAANANPGPDTITVPIGTYTLTIAGMDEDAGATGDLDITDDVTIVGSGAATTIIDGGALDRVMHVTNATTAVDISGVTITNGNQTSMPVSGAGIANAGTLTLGDVVITNNMATGGGGIRNDGTLTLNGVTVSANNGTIGEGGGIYNTGGLLNVTDSTISGNTAHFGGGIRNSGGTVTLTGSTVAGNTSLIGGGIDSDSGSVSLTDSTVIGNTGGTGGGIFSQDALTVTRSTVSGNTAVGGFGGGIYNSLGMATITNSTISGNLSDIGAGIYNPATLSVVNSTITDNAAIGALGIGGGIQNEGPATLKNTIVGSNPAGGDCSAFVPITSNGNNLDSDGTCGLGGPGDLPGAIPLLGPLTDNGGPTRTHALLAGSPAIDAGGNVACPATDQRGVARPQGAGCDIGAYESGDADADGVPDGIDNCPAWPNPGQSLPPWPIPPDDPDCDGFDSTDEAFMGTLPLVHCAATGVADGIDNDGDTLIDESGEGANDENPDPWPPDANDDQDTDVGDIIALFIGRVPSSAPGPPYQQRSDFNGDGDIDVGDIIAGFLGRVSTTCV